MSDHHAAWRPLQVTSHEVPKLLVSTTFTPSSYTVHVTDLANIWKESLDRKAICMRGFKEDTSIDPSEDQSQMLVFLQKIQAAFYSSHADHSMTSLTLSRSRADDTDGALELHLTCILPQPLKPLKWPIYLKKCNPSITATKLVLPLIQAHYSCAREIDKLVAVLQQKDGIITRLVDKLEATGTGLEHVFNSLSGKRKVTRATAEERVRGLAPFDEAKFRRTIATSREIHSQDVQNLLDSVFGGDTGLSYHPDMDVDNSPMLDDWWNKLDRGRTVSLFERGATVAGKKAETPPPSLPNAVRKTANHSDEDDEFQVQATPPHLISAKKRGPGARMPPVDDDASTDGEEEVPDSVLVVSSPAKTAGAVTTGKTSTSTLGSFSKSKMQSPSPPLPRYSPEPGHESIEDAQQDDDTSETASEADDTMRISPTTQSAQPQKVNSLSQPKPSGLGRIGGKAKAATNEPAPATGSKRSSSPGPAAVEPAPKTRKLGLIGKVAADDSEVSGDGGESKGGLPVLHKPKTEERPPSPAETEEERANKKRQELQRELDRRAGAGAKKKRKF